MIAWIFSLGCLDMGTLRSKFSSTNSLTNICKREGDRRQWFGGQLLIYSAVAVFPARPSSPTCSHRPSRCSRCTLQRPPPRVSLSKHPGMGANYEAMGDCNPPPITKTGQSMPLDSPKWVETSTPPQCSTQSYTPCIQMSQILAVSRASELL